MTAPEIESYSFGSIRVDGELYREDILIFPDGVRTVWRRKKGHSLDPEDIPDIMTNPPDILIIGTGKNGRMDVPESTRKAVKKLGVKLSVDPTEKAVKNYMSKKDSARTVAALHLTC